MGDFQCQTADLDQTADYMLHHLKIEESEVPQMCVDLYKEHGTTMAGLKVQVIFILLQQK